MIARPASLAILVLLAGSACAQTTPPVIVGIKPLGLGAGRTETIEVRGSDLDGVSAILIDAADARAEIVEAKGDHLKVRFTAPEAKAGPLSFRVLSPRGLSNAASLYVGRPLPTVVEKEPNDGFKAAQPIHAPAIVAGEIRNGDEVDLFAVDLRKGQTLVAEAVAARAGSGLDALVTIFSPDRRELSSSDDLFGPDGACWAVASVDGRYFIQIQDANGRNPNAMIEGQKTRDYLLSVGEFPIVVSAFPPAVQRGSDGPITLGGVNLGNSERFRPAIGADTTRGEASLFCLNEKGRSNPFTVRISPGIESIERPLTADDGHRPAQPQILAIPGAVSGRLTANEAADFDLYRLVPEPGRAGLYAITATAARFGSAADPVLSILDDAGKTQAEDDDKLGRDAQIEREIGPEGILVSVRDAFARGGPRSIYRIEAELLPRRRFTIRGDLAGLTVPRNGSLLVPVALERAGFDGPVSLFAADLPPGVSSAPITIPGGARGGFLLLSAEETAPLGPFSPRLVARDSLVPPEFRYREGGKAIDLDRLTLAVGEPASLGISIGPDESGVTVGAEAEFRVQVARRSDPAKQAVKLRLVVGGSTDFFEKVADATLPADKDEHVFRLKTRGNAPSGRVLVSVLAWLSGSNESRGVAASPVALNLKKTD